MTTEELQNELGRRFMQALSTAELQAELARRLREAATKRESHLCAIVDWLAASLDLPASSLLSDRKWATLADKRAIAMWVVRETTRASLVDIAAAFNRDCHATVLAAIAKVNGRADLLTIARDLAAKRRLAATPAA